MSLSDPPETPETPSRPSMKRPMPPLRRPLIIVIAMIVAVGLIVAIGALLTRESSSSAQYDAPDRLSVKTDGGKIELVASTGDKVEVERTAKYILRKGEAEDRVDGDTLVLEFDCPRFNIGSCRTDVKVMVPSSVEVTADSSNGDVQAEGLRGSAEMRSGNGKVEATATFGDLRLESDNGDIEAKDLLSTELFARTDNGSIDIEFATAPTSVDAESDNGNLDLRVPKESGPFAVDATSGNGKAVAEVRTDPESENKIRLRSGNGDVQIRTR